MKKLLGLTVAISALSSLYGFSISIGGGYENIGGSNQTDPYFTVHGDVTFNVLPILGCRLGLLRGNFNEGQTSVSYGITFEPAILFYGPVLKKVNPYIVLLDIGYHEYQRAVMPDYNSNHSTLSDSIVENETRPLEIENASTFNLKSGVGVEMFFTPKLGCYLESGVNFNYTKFESGNTDTQTPLYIQAGLKIPITL